MASARHRTAISRDELSRPLRLAILHEIVDKSTSVLDYGCGRGGDVSRLKKKKIKATGWDPYYQPETKRKTTDVVNLGFVVNVVEDPIERAEVLREEWKLTRQTLIVSARLENELDDAHVTAFGDGWMTRQGTFQKFFEHDELGAWIQAIVREKPIAAGPGTYYIFRRTIDRERYLASRFRRPITLPRPRPSDEDFKKNKKILEPLVEFVAERGRLPAAHELSQAVDLEEVFGSLRKAFRVVQWVTDKEAWDLVRLERSIDLLVHLALAKFHGRLRWSELPDEIQRDVRAFHRSYKAACEKADKLLFATGNKDAILLACRASGVGKMTPTAVYVHETALSALPALLRVYEGCARAIAGTVDGANVIKLFRDQAKVSYLVYEDFDKDSHPALCESVVCDLMGQTVKARSYRRFTNLPILHRKEMLVTAQYPNYEKFKRLTKAEEKAGLFKEPSRIGFQNGWEEVLKEAGVRVSEHRVREGGTFKRD